MNTATNLDRQAEARHTIGQHAEDVAHMADCQPVDSHADSETLMLESIACLMAALAALNRDTGRMASAVYETALAD